MNKIITLLVLLTLFVGCNEDDPQPIEKKVTATPINEARIPEPKVFIPVIPNNDGEVLYDGGIIDFEGKGILKKAPKTDEELIEEMNEQEK